MQAGEEEGGQAMTPPRWLSEAEIEALSRLEREATPVPWELDKHLNPNDISVWYKGDFLANLVEHNAEDGRYSLAFDLQRVEDAKFLAALRNAAPALLAMAREMLRLLEQLRLSTVDCANEEAEANGLRAELERVKRERDEMNSSELRKFFYASPEWLELEAERDALRARLAAAEQERDRLADKLRYFEETFCLNQLIERPGVGDAQRAVDSDRIAVVLEERDRYKAALEEIVQACDMGADCKLHWCAVAREALRPDPKPREWEK